MGEQMTSITTNKEKGFSISILKRLDHQVVLIAQLVEQRST